MTTIPRIGRALALLTASVAGQVVGGLQASTAYSALAAGLFAGTLLALGLQLNRPWWQPAGEFGPGGDVRPMLAARNAGLLALGYLWGGLSLLAVYLGTPVKWQHGWQYGSGMVLIGLVVLVLATRIERNWTPRLEKALVIVSLVHGWAAIGGLAWLIGSGKWLSMKGDWAANVIFFAGAVGLVGINAMALRSARILSQFWQPPQA